MLEVPDRYAHRTEAGRVLASQMSLYAHRDDVVVLGLPRGGVPVAVQVAQALQAPLDILIVRKLGLPMQPEVAMGAIASVGGNVEMVRNEQAIDAAQVTQQSLDEVYARELAELRRRDSLYREGRPPIPLDDRTAILVDDGLATGSTMLAAINAVRNQDPAQVVVAVPIGAEETCATLGRYADAVFCTKTPDHFRAVGQGYVDFSPTEDDEVTEALRAHAESDPGQEGP